MKDKQLSDIRSFFCFVLMVEETYSGEAHHHVVLITCFDDMIVSHRAARFRDVADAGLMGTFDVVAKREEGV